MGKVKYIRVSSEEQNTSRQKQNEKEFSKIYIDKVSGTEGQLLDKYKIVVKELTENKQSLRRAALLGGCSLGTAQKIKRIIQKQDNRYL